MIPPGVHFIVEFFVLTVVVMVVVISSFPDKGSFVVISVVIFSSSV